MVVSGYSKTSETSVTGEHGKTSEDNQPGCLQLMLKVNAA